MPRKIRQLVSDLTIAGFVRWNEEDNLYVGHCPELFPWGGVCHGVNEEETYRQLCVLVHEEVEQLRKDGRS